MTRGTDEENKCGKEDIISSLEPQTTLEPRRTLSTLEPWRTLSTLEPWRTLLTLEPWRTLPTEKTFNPFPTDLCQPWLAADSWHDTHPTAEELVTLPRAHHFKIESLVKLPFLQGAEQQPEHSLPLRRNGPSKPYQPEGITNLA